MKKIVLGSNGFIAKSLRDQVKNNRTDFSFIGKDKINFLNKNSVTKFKKILNKEKKIILIIISAIAPAKNIEDYYKNILIMKNILISLDEKKIKKIIYISSDAVYSDTKKKITEISETNPNNFHGLMHLNREKMINLYFPKKKITILRPTLVFGKEDTHNSYGPNKFMRNVINNENLLLFGRGEEKRDHIHISFLVSVILKAVNSRSSGVFNVVSGKTVSFLDIAKKCIKFSKNKIKIKFLKRNGPLPHLGLRQFNNIKLKKKFNNLQFSPIDIKLSEYL